jgi:ParB/RepB/Spo0J family partition protein
MREPHVQIPSLQLLELSKIVPNEINPRGPNVRENDPHRENLKQSIAEFGILVPLVVRPLEKDKYELIDGERRYWIAQSLKLLNVPVFIVNGGLDETALLQRMFQIHMNRDQWDPVQQCKASESLFSKLKLQHKANLQGMIDDFAKFTGTDRRTARNRVQFLSWPEAVKREIYNDPSKHDSYWYVVEIEDKIVEPGQKNYPEYFEKVNVDDVRRFLYRKWEANIVKAAVDVRQAAIVVRSQVQPKGRRKEAVSILNKLVKEIDFTYEDAFKEFAQKFPTLVEPKLPKPRALVNSIRNLSEILSHYEPIFLETYRKRSSPIDEIIESVTSLIGAAQKFLKRMKD